MVINYLAEVQGSLHCQVKADTSKAGCLGCISVCLCLIEAVQCLLCSKDNMLSGDALCMRHTAV